MYFSSLFWGSCEFSDICQSVIWKLKSKKFNEKARSKALVLNRIFRLNLLERDFHDVKDWQIFFFRNSFGSIF
jgi:hypothetical protein